MKTHVNLRVLSDEDKERIGRYTVRLLEEVGVWVQCDRALQVFTDAGYSEENRRVLVPEAKLREMLNWYVAKVPRKEPPETGIPEAPEGLGVGDNVPWVYDLETGELRQPRIQDQIDACYLANGLEKIATVGEVADFVEFHPQTRQLHSFLAGSRVSKKQQLDSHELNAQNWKYFHELMIIQHGEEKIRTRGYSLGSDMSSPMRLSKFTSDKWWVAFDNGLGVGAANMPMPGATAPMSLAATIGQGFAELFFAGVFFYLMCQKYGDRSVYLSFDGITADMRTMQDLYAAPECILMRKGATEMWEYWGLPGVFGGQHGAANDAKEPDIQCGFEEGLSGTLSLLCGGRVAHTAGVLDTVQAFCLEKVLIDLDIFEMLSRIPEGVEIREEDFDLDLARTGAEQTNFTNLEHTGRRFRSEMSLPQIFTHEFIEVWRDRKQPIWERARQRTREIVAQKIVDPKFDEDTLREIEKIVARADQEFAG